MYQIGEKVKAKTDGTVGYIKKIYGSVVTCEREEDYILKDYFGEITIKVFITSIENIVKIKGE